MSRMIRIVRWVVVGAIALIFTLAAAVLILTRTSRFNDFLRVRIVSYLRQTYRGQITIGAIEGSVWGSLTLREINVRHHGLNIASIAELRVGYYLLPALRGQIVLSDIDVIRPQARLARDPDGQWNLIAALVERQASPPSAPTNVTVALRRVAIQHAYVNVTTSPGSTYQLSNGNFSGSGKIGPSGQSFNLDTIAFALNGPGVIARPRVRRHRL